MRKSSQVIIIIIITDWSLLTDGAGEVGGGRGEGGGEGGGGGDGTATTGIRDEDDGEMGRRRGGRGDGGGRERGRGSWVRVHYYCVYFIIVSCHLFRLHVLIYPYIWSSLSPSLAEALPSHPDAY